MRDFWSSFWSFFRVCSPEHRLLHSRSFRLCWACPWITPWHSSQPQPQLWCQDVLMENTSFSSWKLTASLEEQPSPFSLIFCSLWLSLDSALAKLKPAGNNKCIPTWKNKLQCILLPPALPVNASQGSEGERWVHAGLPLVGSLWAIVLGALLHAGQVLKTRLVSELLGFWKTEHRHCS